MAWAYQKGDRWYLVGDLVTLPPRFRTSINTHGIVVLSDWHNGCAEVEIAITPKRREVISFEELDAANNMHYRVKELESE